MRKLTKKIRGRRETGMGAMLYFGYEGCNLLEHSVELRSQEIVIAALLNLLFRAMGKEAAG